MRGYFCLLYHGQVWRGEDGCVWRDGREFPEDRLRWNAFWHALDGAGAWNRWEVGQGQQWSLEARRAGRKLVCRGGVEPDWLGLLLRLLSGFDPDMAEPSDAAQLSAAIARIELGVWHEVPWPLAFTRQTLREVADHARAGRLDEAREMVDRLNVRYSRQRVLLEAGEAEALALRAEEMAGQSTELELALEAFAESAYPALHDLLEMGEEARAALPLARQWLQGIGWENSGAEGWEERALLKDGWRLYRRWASLDELKEALNWGNSRAVVESCEELAERGEPWRDFVEALVWAVGGTWGRSAGALLRKLGDVGRDDALWMWLECGYRGAAAALGARHPGRVVSCILRRGEDLEMLLHLAGPEAIPALIKGLYSLGSRDVCDRVLCQYERCELAPWLPRQGGLVPPAGLSGRLACLLWDWNPGALGVWAEGASLEQLQEALDHAQVQIQGYPAGYGRSHYFLQAAGQLPVEVRDLQRGLRDGDPATVWCALRAARRLPARDHQQLQELLARLSQDPELQVRSEVESLRTCWETPFSVVD
ncbi:MAG: hypothetical protein U0931_32025 [Vulcanimicrobiota bacterium]